ncbi:MAG: hypothetical protein ACI9PD_001386 [Psychrobacter glaciei]|jgi:hypothetical protein
MKKAGLKEKQGTVDVAKAIVGKRYIYFYKNQ